MVGSSENHGVEQERLNDVPGARLRITTLRADSNPGIELLEYLAPRDGRPLPPDTRLDDLVAWRTVMRLASPDRLVPLLAAVGARRASPGAAAGDAVVVRDVDGHALELRRR